jgi:photosystem II stability/assembly factor-like uncharacterized protein
MASMNCMAQIVGAQETAVWQNRPAGMRELIIGMKGSQKIVLLTREGGSLASSNNGESWNQLGLPSLNYDLAATKTLFLDSANIYVMYSTGYMVKADLKGNSAQVIRKPVYHSLNDFYFLNDKKGFAVSDMHLIRTTDGGISWKYLPYTEDGKLVGVPELGAGTDFHKDTIAACSASGRRIYLGNEKWLAIAFADTKNGYAVGESTYWNQRGKPVLMKTDDGGNTWTKQKVSFTDKGFHAITFLNKKVGFIAGSGSSVFKTIDGGATWEPCYSGDPELTFTQVAFVNESFVYATSTRNMQTEAVYTEDQGKTWKKLDWNTKAWQDMSTEFKNDVLKQVGLKANTWETETNDKNWQMIYNKVSSGTMKYSERYHEKIWSLYSKEDRWRSVYFESPSDIWVIDSWRGLVFKSNDKGNSWGRVNVDNGLTGADLYSVYFADEKTGIAVGENSTILRTENGGEKWNAVNVNAKDELIKNLSFVTKQLGFAQSKNYIFKTSNAGKDWTTMPIKISNKRVFTDTVTSYYSEMEMADVFFRDETLGFADFVYYHGYRNECWPPVPNGPVCDPTGPTEEHAPAITTDGGRTWKLFDANNQFLSPNGTIYTYTTTVRKNAKSGERGYYMAFLRSSKDSDGSIVWIPELRKEKVLALKYTQTVKEFGVEQMRMDNFNDEFIVDATTKYLVGKGGRILKVIAKK